MAGVTTFRENNLSINPLDGSLFESYDARYMRYAVLWAFVENTAYSNIHAWSTKFKSDFALYKYTRPIYNPAFRLATFWQSHLWGGMLDIQDAQAGDKGSLPIVTSNDNLRAPLARLWQDSNWQVRKDITSLQGASLGDVGIRVVDDTSRGIVYLEHLHPGTLADVVLDQRGFVKGYVVVETRLSPFNPQEKVEYREVVQRGEGEEVIYQTYLNGKPFAWNGEASEWVELYGFVPMVFIQNFPVGLRYGWSEMQAGLGRFREVDDIASKMSDHIRKYVDPMWVFTGTAKPTNQTAAQGASSTGGKPQPGRDELPAIWLPTAGSDAKPLVANLDIGGTLAHLAALIDLLEHDYPELRASKLNLSGEVTGRALKVAQQPAEQKVKMRRANYDSNLIRAQQMALAIGGYRGYQGYEGFNLDSYNAGRLDHSIGERPVFDVTTLDQLEEEGVFWATAKTAREAGLDPVLFLREHGWDDDRIKEFTSTSTYQELSFVGYPATVGEPAVTSSNSDNSADPLDNNASSAAA